jgi:hypothetical protein
MAYIMVDVEADGPCPGLYSMISSPQDYIADDKILEHYFYKIDGKFCERLCNSIKEMM